MSYNVALGIIGGSGVYDIDGLQNKEWRAVESSFGQPSDELLFGELNGLQLVFLPRHGRGHVLSPSDINYRANIDALKRSGVTDVLSISAVGSLKENLAPGTFVIVDQFIDRTFNRQKSFLAQAVWPTSRWRILCVVAWAIICSKQPRSSTYLWHAGALTW